MVRWSEATEEVAAPVEPELVDERRRRMGGPRFTVVLAVVALGFLVFAVLRILGIEGNAFLVGAVALTPYVAGGGVVLGLLSLLLRRRVTGFVVLLMSFAVAALLVPRYLAEEQPGADGPLLRVMAVNLYLGQGDARTIVDLVRTQQVDVLTLPELTPAAVSNLDAAGLYELLPYRVSDDRVGGDGSGIAARVPLRKIVPIEESTLGQTTAVVDLPGTGDVEVTAVHVQPPLDDADLGAWRDELDELPRANPRERVRVLAGDFNATLDHGAFRALVDRGYADAAEETGHGLEPTWSNLPFGPPLTIDHVVADARCAFSSYAVFDVPGSDHNAVLAEIVLP